MKPSRLSKLAISVSLALSSGLAGAALRDRGPENTTNHFPNWYRDANGLALGQCINSDDAGNGPLCLLAGVEPTGFAGNFGEEGFYGTADILAGGFHWMGHLEMAYFTANGLPPAVWNAADRQEVVFSRERMIFDVPAGCAGHYTVRTPFKVHQLDLEEGRRALFYTDDILPIAGDFNAALKGHTGPFLVWDHVGPNDAPASQDNPAITVPQPVGPARKYAGDPNIPHTFVGSTLPAGPGHEDKGFNNYLEVIPPASCDLGAGPGVPLFEENAAISGLIWDQPIADPVTITKAAYTRNGTVAGLDVWVSGPKNQNLVLTAATDASQHVPSMTIKEETRDGATTGTYHAHLEFSPTATIPPQVTVTNVTSNPQARHTAAVTDAVVVTKSVYDPLNKKLCITAHSGDETNPNSLSLEAPSYGAFGPATETCPKVAANDMALEKDLTTFAPDLRFPPEGILVQSSRGGKESSQPVVLATGSSNEAPAAAAIPTDTVINLDGTGITALPLPTGGVSNARIVVVGQPEQGSVFANVDGTASFQAIEGMASGPQTFFYAVQAAGVAEQPVTNVGKVTLNVTQVIPPPVTVPDSQGVFRTSPGATINVLSNDVTGLTPTPIDAASIELQPLNGYALSADSKTLTGPRGTVTALSNGTLRYVPTGQGATANNTLFTVQYTVANTAGNGRRSNPTNVSIVLKSAAEAIAFQRVRFANAWDIRFTSTYAGAAGAVTLAPAATCSLYTNAAAYANGAGVPRGIVGSAAPGAGTNAYVVAGATPSNAGLGNTWVIGCTTSSGGRASRTGTL